MTSSSIGGSSSGHWSFLGAQVYCSFIRYAKLAVGSLNLATSEVTCLSKENKFILNNLTMETKITIDDLVTVIKVVRNNQKTQLARINELEKKVESLEKDLENEKQETR